MTDHTPHFDFILNVNLYYVKQTQAQCFSQNENFRVTVILIMEGLVSWLIFPSDQAAHLPQDFLYTIKIRSKFLIDIYYISLWSDPSKFLPMLRQLCSHDMRGICCDYFFMIWSRKRLSHLDDDWKSWVKHVPDYWAFLVCRWISGADYPLHQMCCLHQGIIHPVNLIPTPVG